MIGGVSRTTQHLFTSRCSQPRWPFSTIGTARGRPRAGRPGDRLGGGPEPVRRVTLARHDEEARYRSCASWVSGRVPTRVALFVGRGYGHWATSSVRMGQLLLPLLRLLQDSALLNADETFPLWLLSVETVDCAELARLFT